MNPTVEAAWIAAGSVAFGVTGTVIIGVVGFRSTRAATNATVQGSRGDRLWERKADAYQDALTAALYRKERRNEMIIQLGLGTDLNLNDEEYAAIEEQALTNQTEDQWLALMGRLGTFGSPPVLEAYEKAQTANLYALSHQRAARKLRKQVAMLRLQQSTDPVDADKLTAAELELDRSAEEFGRIIRDAGTADEALEDAIRADLNPETTPTLVISVEPREVRSVGRQRVRRIRLGGMLRHKPSTEAQQKYQADEALTARRAELLDAAHEAESQLRQAQARRAPEAEIRRLAEDLDTALTDAMRAAYAAQRAEIGPRGYEDRIYRRKARATPRVHALTAEAERLLTLRETHRLNGIPAVTFVTSPPPSPVSEA
jgi:hypothetical protein